MPGCNCKCALEVRRHPACLCFLESPTFLGLLLFLIYIDDVAAISLSQGSTLNLYVDDILLYKLIASGSTQDFAVVQSDINIVGNWVDENYLTLNSAKCKYMTISRKRGNSADQVQLSVNGTPLEHVQSSKYLGLTISSDLSWSAHIISTCSKARKLIGLLYRRFYSNTTSESLLELYRVIVRPHLEYAATVWDPHKLKDVKSLEDTQKFALRMCLKEWSCDYQEVLELSSFPTLQNRRCYQKLTTLFKIVNHLLVFPPDKVQKKHQARPSLHPNSDHIICSTILLLAPQPHSSPSFHTRYRFETTYPPKHSKPRASTSLSPQLLRCYCNIYCLFHPVSVIVKHLQLTYVELLL